MYEICRISVDINEPYGSIPKSFLLETIQSSLAHEPYTSWYSEEPLEESVEETENEFIIKKRAYYLMAEATGLNRRDAPALFDGYREEGSLERIWGRDALKKIAEIADRLANVPHSYPAPLIRFIALFEYQEIDYHWKFIGELPVDNRLKIMVVSDVGK